MVQLQLQPCRNMDMETTLKKMQIRGTLVHSGVLLYVILHPTSKSDKDNWVLGDQQ